MAKYNYGKTFTKDGKSVRYRYTNKRRALRNWLVLQRRSHGSDLLNSYFEIGGKIIECILDTPDISHHGQTAQARNKTEH